jgi:hypothetical protein
MIDQIATLKEQNENESQQRKNSARNFVVNTSASKNYSNMIFLSDIKRPNYLITPMKPNQFKVKR